MRDVLAFILKHLPAGAEHVPPQKEFTAMSVRELKAAVQAAGLANKAVGFSEKSDFITLLQGHYNGPHAK